MSYVCPKCRTDKCLWRGVSVEGWQSVGGDLQPSSGDGQQEVNWSWSEPDGTYGCGDCQWEGSKGDLEVLGIDGEPLPKVHPGQERMV